MTAFNYVHYITFFVIFILFVVGVYKSFQQKKASLKTSMLFTTVLVSVFLAVFSVFVVDKYTKSAKLYKVKNKRLLSVEKIVYSGIVKNTGNFPIKKVTIEIKLVNQGHATGNVKGGNFYKSTGFFEFFNEGLGIEKDKPQTIIKRFVIARDMKAGKAESFRVYFDYPPYFRSAADYISIEAH
ncbi:DUF2393 family protein [Sulfurimonas marina]|uniref:DUF2393 domain-containing protein n=1 Tax=Sulfurimonas marina TaxID=2590551 RepID=A0A7M1AX24_9BACT|nr:DUF2393 family protein [Sulfurimonas marina]QOP41990.1 DUF2393 domain-containing protein [Sulfurimonas marina]